MKKTQAITHALVAVVWVVWLQVAAAAPSAGPATSFRVRVARGGLFSVSHDRLAAAGLAGDVPTSRIGLFDAGVPRALWIEDGGDGHFGPGDTLRFAADAPSRAASYGGGESPLRVYTLQFETTGGTIGRASGTDTAPAGDPGAVLDATLELERDLLREAVIGAGGPGSNTWYWAELTHADRDPFDQPVTLAGLDRASDRPVALSIHVLGRSRLNAEQRSGGARDHRMIVRWNGREVGTFDWDSDGEPRAVEVALRPAAVRPGDNTLSLELPSRFLGSDPADAPAVDVVLLDRIALRYPHGGEIARPQERLEIAAGSTGRCVVLRPANERPLALWRADGLHFSGAPADASGRRRFCAAAGWPAGLGLVATLGPPALEPAAIEPVRPPRLARTDNQADYVMITHPRLREALEPLAAFHRERGLTVAVVSVEDVYDEFHDGVRHPAAIREFLEFAIHEWRPPAPRFVLLAGDASWDRRQPGHRDLVPTTTAAGRYGHAASDNPFACVADDDDRPDLALGRLPAATPEELSAMVAKTIRHVSHSAVGPWKRRILWITDDQPASRQRSDAMARRLAGTGFLATRIYASGDAPAADRSALFDAFARGHVLVHFYGHGGRLVWRTGPPDPGRNRELFSLQNLDDLAPAERYPVVLGLTCYSAPFDHPTEDSIGERFVRLPDRGAIAVIAAGWRNAPTPLTTRRLVEQLVRPGTVGEALMRAKREGSGAAFRAQYNLLGDPALPLALPALDVRVRAVRGGPRIRVRIEDGRFAGRAIVDWVDPWGTPLHTAEYGVERGRVEAAFPGDDARDVAGAVAYVWDPARGIDGMGGIAFAADAEAP